MSKQKQTPQNTPATVWEGKTSTSDKATEAGLKAMAPRLAGLVVEEVTHDQVRLRWISRDEKTIPLRVIRGTPPEFKDEHEVLRPKEPNGVFDDDGLAANTLYYYKLIFDWKGEEYEVTVETYTMPAP